MLLFFETVILKKHVNTLLIIATLLTSASRGCCRCWCLVVVVGVLAVVPRRRSRCCCRLVVVDVSSLSAAVTLLVAESVGICASSLTVSCRCCRWRLHPNQNLHIIFVPKFKQVIGTNREVFEIFLALLFSQQLPGLSNRCMFALANGLTRRFI